MGMEYKYKWGGEDWDLLDRVINAELKVVRIEHPGLSLLTEHKSWNQHTLCKRLQRRILLTNVPSAVMKAHVQYA